MSKKGCCEWLKRKCEQIKQKITKKSPQQDNQKNLILNDKQENNLQIVCQGQIVPQRQEEDQSNKQNLEILSGWENENQSNKQNDEKQQVEEELSEMRNILIVGQVGVGKRTLFKNISGQDENVQTKFPCYIFQIGKFKISLINSPNFQMTPDINLREQAIKNFKEFFDKNKEIDIFLILVNFERTDMMHDKFQNVYRYIKKFKDKICLGITQFQLSEDKTTDQEHLLERFERFVENRRERILFFEQDVGKEKLQEQLFKLIDQNALRTQLDLKDTFFEDDDINEQQRIWEDIQNKLNNKKLQVEIRIQN